MSPHVASRVPAGWACGLPAAHGDAWRPEPLALGAGETTETATAGDGPALLLVPSIVGWKEVLAPSLIALGEHFRATAYDLREGACGWERHDADLERVAETFAPGGYALLGYSFGSTLALRHALAHPERVRALVLVSAFARLRLGPAHWWRRGVVQSAVLLAQRALPERAWIPLGRRAARRGLWVLDEHCEPALLRSLQRGVRGTRPGQLWPRLRLAAGFDARPWLERVRVPTLVVVGEREARHTREACEELASGIPGAALAVLPGANHMLPLSRPRALADTVASWYATRPASGDGPGGGVP